ncbi:hypothetical protein SAMN05421812_101720 [Asanoa hainanensis]|uniref:Uncharacterized protein n=1 Tax=Asanoa hainanensis TaxID=560556 RepID=A0A239H856_9ACTN|nr:hypothetical protein [Asanoa hainanensis]SNS77003.1 hypothetical protein SAMN05421812_101720 [Asanoa hainanensis]
MAFALLALVAAVAVSVAVAAWRKGAAARRWHLLRAWADGAGWQLRPSAAEVGWLPAVALPIAVVDGRHEQHEIAVVWSAGKGATTTVYLRVADHGAAVASYQRWLDPTELDEAVLTALPG